MNQTIFNTDEMTMLREMVFETALQDWCVAWQAKDSSTLDQLAIWSSRMAGPDRENAEVEAMVITVYDGMQQAMIRDIGRNKRPGTEPILKDLLAVSARCKLALAQLNKGAQDKGGSIIL
jgi:hypothetical protein